MFQAALTVHDIDADSAMGTSIITDDRSSCRFSDDEEVSECVYVYHNATRKVCNCANTDNIDSEVFKRFFSDACLHMHKFESISAAVEDTHKTMLFTHIEKCVCTCS